MKKLMIVAAVCALAGVASAASVAWKTSGSATAKTIYAADGKTKLYAANSAAMAYLFAYDTGTKEGVTQASLLAGLRGGEKKITDFASISSQAITSDSQLVNKTEIEAGDAGKVMDFFWAIVNGDDVLLSETKSATLQSATESPLQWSSLSTFTKNSNDFTASFDKGGWYATTNVPEPTSGLLLLLGVAGLALRRRRA